MHVRMVQQILPPRVQDREEADLRTEMFWIGGDRAQRFGGRVVANPMLDEADQPILADLVEKGFEVRNRAPS